MKTRTGAFWGAAAPAGCQTLTLKAKAAGNQKQSNQANRTQGAHREQKAVVPEAIHGTVGVVFIEHLQAGVPPHGGVQGLLLVGAFEINRRLPASSGLCKWDAEELVHGLCARGVGWQRCAIHVASRRLDGWRWCDGRNSGEAQSDHRKEQATAEAM